MLAEKTTNFHYGVFVKTNHFSLAWSLCPHGGFVESNWNIIAFWNSSKDLSGQQAACQFLSQEPLFNCKFGKHSTVFTCSPVTKHHIFVKTIKVNYLFPICTDECSDSVEMRIFYLPDKAIQNPKTEFKCL